MNFTFLGTCAADFSREGLAAIPDRFDKDIRRASTALLDGRFLIDAGPHVTDCLRIAGIPYGTVTDIFLTHLHKDHFNPENVAALAKGREVPLRLWVREDAVLPEIPGIEVHRMRLFETCTVEEGFTVMGLPANHAQTAFPQHLLIEKDGKKIYYGLDGAWFIHGEFQALRDQHLDLIVLDGTCGDYTGDFRAGEHNSIPMIRLMLPSLKTVGAIDDHTKVYISHLARTLHKTYAETAQIGREAGFEVAYDGLTVTM